MQPVRGMFLNDVTVAAASFRAAARLRRNAEFSLLAVDFESHVASARAFEAFTLGGAALGRRRIGSLRSGLAAAARRALAAAAATTAALGTHGMAQRVHQVDDVAGS